MKGQVALFIEEYYPQYYSIERYPADQCAPFNKVKEKWGTFSNFGITPITVEGITFSCIEKLFQCLKFKDRESIEDIYNANGQKVKMKAKKWVKAGRARADWGEHIVNVMKYCLNLKYNQVPEFKKELENSNGKFIVEDQTSFPHKDANTWGVKLVNNEYVGPNLMGRLLMELRDNGKFNVDLPAGWLSDLSFLKVMA